MPRYQAHEDFPHFCTFTVLDWVPVFIDERYVRLILESLRFCREKKGLRLYAYVVMPNHLHLIARADGGLHPVMRDFKRFTSRSVHDSLVADERRTLLSWLLSAMEPGRRERGEFSLWKSGFHPQAIYSEEVLLQKLEYLNNNPVRKGFVFRPEDWRFGSESENRILEVDPLKDLIQGIGIPWSLRAEKGFSAQPVVWPPWLICAVVGIVAVSIYASGYRNYAYLHLDRKRIPLQIGVWVLTAYSLAWWIAANEGRF